MRKMFNSVSDFYKYIYGYYEKYILMKDTYSQKNFNYWFKDTKYKDYDRYIFYSPRNY